MYDFEERIISRHNVLSSLRSDLRSCFPRHGVDLWAERFSPVFLLHDEHFISDRDVSMSCMPVFIRVCLHRLFCRHVISLHASFDCGCFPIWRQWQAYVDFSSDHCRCWRHFRGRVWCGSVISQESVHFKVPVFAFYLRGSDGFLDGLHETFRFAVRFWPQWCYSPVFETTEQCVVGKLSALER